jgi:outer membrane cobalamin receptor|tara:strand:+ start:25556 stop:27706 length:2151 start_codon:yes stop_codon:yes gene_type:complete
MKIKLLMVLLLFASTTFAQDIIKGIVKDDQNKTLPGANIVFKNTSKGTTSDKDGKFEIEVTSFPQSLSISFVGFETKEMEVRENTFLDISLSSSISIDEVEVTSKVNSTEFSLISPLQTQKISRDELQKAACCNLSESFETNATIDVIFSDAVSGAKQIQMLGLDGVYTQITQENLPLIRGISSSYGLTHTPGTWIESIQIIKGAGSVVNGFESFTGQINVNYQTAETADKLFWNSYVNSEGRIENNLQLAKKNGKWKSNLFLSYQYHENEVDNNDDNFLDVPHLNSINVLNKWKTNTENINATISVRAIVEERDGGQIESISNPYLVNIDNQLFELSGKLGFINPDDCNKSVGSQYSIKKHDQFAQFGNNTYDGTQESIFLNIIRQTYLSNSDHTLKYGLSFFGDRYTESVNTQNLDRTDLISGVFSEYSYVPSEDFTLTAGFRSDYHNKFGMNYLPRLNARYNFSDDLIVRFSIGKSFRISNPVSENLSYLASSRTISVNNDLLPEKAWSYGANITRLFKLFDREASFNADAYRTDFSNQIVVDIESQSELSFANLNGESYSNSYQFDFSYAILDRLDLKLAYKINRVYSTFDNEKKLVPLTPKDRSLINLAYSTNHLRKWMFDVTLNRIGESRLPSHQLIDKEFSDPFIQINSQVTKKYTKIDLYLGVENALDYKQDNPILSSDNPNSPNFDASIIWAPIMGRLFYAGFRFKI